MQKQFWCLAVVGIFTIASLFSTLQSVNAAESAHEGKVTNYGDGIIMSENKDQSGFEMDGGGARFIFDRVTQTVVLIEADGAKTAVQFSKPESEVATTNEPVDLVAKAK
jgi:hypothetical protein